MSQNNIIEINEDNFKKIISQTPNLVLLDFWADWCVPCKLMFPILDEICKKYPNIVIGKINIENNHDLALQFNIRSIPTLIFLKNEIVKEQLIGQHSLKEIENFISKFL
ncbi:MAG: thioredoxin [Deltaproteobacteria bacterium]|nr:MAG: thioredoxin [Deltaproteobacteria bacterium]